MKSKLMNKYGQMEEINYYDVESKCIDIINQSNEAMKEKFMEFKKNYQYFTPYFDFVILELGYTIENPMGINNSLLLGKNDKIYILRNVNLKGDGHLLKECDKQILSKCDNASLNIDGVPYEVEKFQNGIIDRNNNFISLGDMLVHNDLATIVVNQMIVKNKTVYETFIEYQNMGYQAINFLQNEFGYVRVGVIDKILLTYNEEKISYKQEDYISFLKSNHYLESFGDCKYRR